MKLEHPKLVRSLQRAYSAEKAAALAYIGNAGAAKKKTEKAELKQIEDDEWHHRAQVLKIMRLYDIPVSKFYELKYYIIGKTIAISCYVIGWFMPLFFAGKLESGNVCEYFVMMVYFHEAGITEHDKDLYDMGIKEKEHEAYFLQQIRDSKLLPFFEKLFKWGKHKSYNDVELKALRTVEESGMYCKNNNKDKV
jgi:hypothetical protein|tara:strand:- start:2156 stop:2737 length:582 start_codon:yes stop_codon:yes gene_type:complete